jgi:hypothetical protein
VVKVSLRNSLAAGNSDALEFNILAVGRGVSLFVRNIYGRVQLGRFILDLVSSENSINLSEC